MRYFLLLFACCFCSSAFAQDKAKLSPLTQLYLKSYNATGKLEKGYVYKKSADGKQFVSALAMVGNNMPPQQQSLDMLGVKVGTKAGKVWTLQIPVDKVAEAGNISGIAYLQLDEPIHANMDSARRATRVDSVQAGLGTLPQAYWGDGVVVGIIDAGFDYRHPTLFDTAGTVYRVKKVWEQLGTGTPPSGFSYGSEMTNPMDMWTKGYDIFGSHGAHVSGIAAGSGYGSTNPLHYRGMAPAADLVLVGITPPPDNWTSTGMSDIIDGMNYVYDYAASVSKPAVVNLSWGCSIGPHDGLSLFSQACDALTGPGKLFVCSAGNNGDLRLHVQKTFTATDNMVHSFPGFDAALPEKKTWLDIWGDSSKTFCVRLSLWGSASMLDSTQWFCLDNQTHDTFIVGSNLDTVFASITTSDAEFNGKPRIFIKVYSRVNDALAVSIKGTSGRVDMWSGIVVDTRGYYGDFTNGGFGWATMGSNSITIGDMASTKSALAVAAYASRNKFTDVSGNLTDYSFYAAVGQRVPFSSWGPTRDGRIKPDITAPGFVLGSAISSYDSSFMSTGDSYDAVVEEWNDPNNGRTYSYAMLMGTSMSSPAAAGIAALMLQVAPTLTPQQADDIITSTAIKDVYTGPINPPGSPMWGAGKINAMKAVSQTIALTGVDHVPVAQKLFIAYPNPADDIVNIAFNTKLATTATITVTDIMGKTVYNAQPKAKQGYNDIVIPVHTLTKGVYLVTLTLGAESQMQRIVVK